ncbi:TetR family transcriptional regulator [Dietzia sp. CH92]|uniref:acyl-CoA-like ligand-binding transcription factor n=1 Tax=Dietzia sp. CH92 TaxID=3051823 RepID=UPI0028D4CBBB|nr:TetR family transcriptional regulator [Dietzia sp. CH92]
MEPQDQPPGNSPGRTPGRAPGRRPSTTRGSIVSVALELFDRQGYEATSVDQIAEAAHISRRTLFRYFPGKAAIAWGEFDEQIHLMLDYLDSVPDEVPLREALADALVEFNTFPDSQTGVHRTRMRLLLGVDELRAHSTLVYADWRRAVAGFVAHRRGESVDDLIPASTAHAALGIALSAYRIWVHEPDADQTRLHGLLRDGTRILA